MIDKELQRKFDGLEFESENHTYTLKGKNLTPVSNVVSKFYEEFDSDIQSIKYAERHGGNPAEIARGWAEYGKERAAFGTLVHDYAERYYYNPTLQPSNNHEVAVVKFWKEIPKHIQKLRAEIKVFNELLGFAGTVDNLLFDTKRNGIIISDYKTNKDLYKNFKGKKMYPPFDFLLDNPLNHYKLQLSTYQLALIEEGFNIIERWVIWLKPDGTYEKILTEDYSMHVKMELLRLELC